MRAIDSLEPEEKCGGPAPATVPGTLDFMVRDSKKFADSGNWG